MSAQTGNRLPSIRQMRARALGIHFDILRAASTGRQLSQVQTISDYRGYRTAKRTLLHWQVIDHEGRLTDRGTELLRLRDTELGDRK